MTLVWLSLMRNLTVSCLLALLLFPLDVCAAPGTSTELGIKSFGQKDYKGALTHFTASLQAHPSDVMATYYCALCYHYMGQTSSAMTMYRRVVAMSPNSKLGQSVSGLLVKLGPKAIGVNRATLAVIPAVSKGPVVRPFRERVVEIEPKFGHSRVQRATLAMVSETLGRLPSNIYKILDEGGATVNVGPNIIDKWPGSGDGVKPGAPNMVMGEEPGRTYGRDVHIYESEIIRGTTELKAPRSSQAIRNLLLHELGHAVEDCLGGFSGQQEVIALFNQDIADMSDDARSRLSYYTQACAEACAEIFAGLTGSQASSAELSLQSFPRLKGYLRRKLQF